MGQVRRNHVVSAAVEPRVRTTYVCYYNRNYNTRIIIVIIMITIMLSGLDILREITQ